MCRKYLLPKPMLPVVVNDIPSIRRYADAKNTLGETVLEIIAQLCGGMGLFLIGMILMTDSLKEMAGETLRVWLTKFTRTPLKSLCSGIGLTLIVQSSTANTLATIGFVGAGVLSFTQAIGVIIGANIGTSSTWLDGGFAGG